MLECLKLGTKLLLWKYLLFCILLSLLFQLIPQLHQGWGGKRYKSVMSFKANLWCQDFMFVEDKSNNERSQCRD